MPQAVLYDTHMHTPLCNHASGEPGDYAAHALKRNLAGIIVTCHNPFPDGYAQASRMKLDEFPTYVKMVQEAATQWLGKVDVKLGLECDYFPGCETWTAKQLTHADFHYVLGSIHPQVSEYITRYQKNDSFAYQQLYFEHLALAAESQLFDCLSHPDLVKNIDPQAWDLDRIWPSIETCLDRIAQVGCAMELNTSGWNKTIPEPNPNPRMLQAMAKRNIPVVLGSDSHIPDRVGDRFEQAMDLLVNAGYQTICYFLNRQRCTVPIDQAKASLVPVTNLLHN